MKKVLAWAVALALVLSSFTMAFADTKTSADFKDASQINYTEAVDVMVATGVINGYPDGTFGPQKTVKRSEMAKMIAVMMNGGEDVGDTYKSACPFADSANHWAAGYIAYCASEHIIDGRSADVFDPEAEVTGTEVAKMALTSLGYDSKTQGYTGDTWAANVLKDAKKAGLFKGLASDFVPGDPCNRECAAQILFNCLKANTVSYETNTTVTVDGTQITVNSGIQENEEALYEDVFDGALVQKPSTTSDGKPAHKWLYEKEEIGEYPDAPAESVVAEEAQSVDEALEAINEDYSAGEVTLNGDAGYDGDIMVGDIVELFETDTEDVYDVTIMRYELAKITGVETEVTAKDLKKDENLTAYVFINNTKYFDTKVVGYDAATYEEDAYIAVAFNNAKEVVDSYLAETAQGEMTEWTADAIKLDDNDYTKSGTYATSALKADFATKNEAGKTIDVYFDKNEYVLGAFAVADDSEMQIAVLTDYTYDLKASERGIKSITLMDKDGKETEYGLNNAGKTAAYEAIEFAEDLHYYEFEDAGFQILVKYELNDNNKVKNIVYWNPLDTQGGDFGILENAEVSKRGLVGTFMLADDAVAFFYDVDEEDSDSNEWKIYQRDELLETTIPVAEYVLDSDGNIAYILLGEDIEAEEEESVVFGFYLESSEKTDADGDKIQGKILKPDGSEYKFITVAMDETFTNEINFETADAKTLIMLELEGDEVTAIKDGYNALNAKADSTADWVDPGFIFTSNPAQVTKAYSSGTIVVGGTTQYIGDANVFRVNYDADEQVDSLSKKAPKDIAADDYVILMKLDKESEEWDTVVYWTAADQEALETFDVTVNAGEGGTAIANPASGKANDTVTITVTPDEGFAIKAVKNGDTVLEGAEGVYTITLDNADVTITVEFEAVEPVEPLEPEPTPGG